MLREYVLPLLAAMFAIILHEVAHGYAALALGDDTAKVQGRLSLNPLRHVDRFGTIILPLILLVLRVGFVFGWAKPVPVAAWRFRDPRRGMAIVAAAGPASNFALALLAGFALHLEPWMAEPWRGLFDDFLSYFILSNLVLGLFNLLPIPPLDGGRIAVGLLPEGLARSWARLERAGIVIVLLVVFLLPRMLEDLAHIRFDPVGTALARLLPWAVRLVLRLSGHGDV